MEEKIFDREELEYSISQAMLWLGYEEVEFHKKFSAKEFEEGKSGEDVMETEIAYESINGLLPANVAKSIAKLLGEVVDYHLKVRNIKIKIKEQKEALIKQEQEGALITEREDNV